MTKKKTVKIQFPKKYLPVLARAKKMSKAKTNAAKLKKLAKEVNKTIEHRWQDDINYSETIPGGGGSGVQIGLDQIATTPSQPLLMDDRLGNKITLKSLYLKGQIIQSDSHNFVRMILAEVTSLGQIVVTADILQPDPITGNPTIYSPYAKDSRIKYHVIHDKLYKTQQQAVGSVYPFLVNFDLSTTWPAGLTITYNSPNNSQPIYKNVMLFLLSDSQSQTHPQFRGAKRLTWIA